MHKRLIAYTSFIKKASANPTKSLIAYHESMLETFRHERLVHLLITLFFVSLTLAAIALSAFLTVANPLPFFPYLLPLYAQTLILVALSVAYIVHYYRLENGLQNLYKFTPKLYDINTTLSRAE